MTKKIGWIYNLKAFGILAVILGHIDSPFYGFIFSWHMPLFFMISGFFIRYEEKVKKFFYKNFKRLMLPYFIFALIALIIEILKRYILHRDSLNILENLKGIFIWMDFSVLKDTYGFVLWFLPALFFAKIFLYLINKNIKNLFLQTVIVLLLFFISFFINFPFAVDNALNVLLFVFMGNIFYRFYQNKKIFYITPLLIILIYIYFGFPMLNLAIKSYSNIIVNIIFSFSMIYLFISFFKKFDFNNKIINNWGNNTMILFIIHPYTNTFSHIITQKYFQEKWYFEFLISLILLNIILYLKTKFTKYHNA